MLSSGTAGAVLWRSSPCPLLKEGEFSEDLVQEEFCAVFGGVVEDLVWGA